MNYNVEIKQIDDSNELIMKWAEAWHMTDLDVSLLPKRPWVAFDKETKKALAIAWVWETNGGLAIIDPLMSDPHSSMRARYRGYMGLVKHVVRYVKDKGYRAFLASVNHPVTERICLAMGGELMAPKNNRNYLLKLDKEKVEQWVTL